MRNQILSALAGTILLANTPGAMAGSILFGGIGGHNISAGPAASANDGSLAIVDQNTAAITIIGHPAGVARISGLAFDATGALYATTQPTGGFPPPPGPTGASNLLRLDPATGAIITSIPVTDGGTPINIADLAVQPGTDSLFGVRGPNDGLGGQGDLYIINSVTGAATLHSVSTADFLGALTVRPDGVIFGGNGDDGELFTVDSVTGAETLVGSTGLSFVGDLAFAVPEPSSLSLLLTVLGGLGGFAWRRRSRQA